MVGVEVLRGALDGSGSGSGDGYGSGSGDGSGYGSGDGDGSGSGDGYGSGDGSGSGYGSGYGSGSGSGSGSGDGYGYGYGSGYGYGYGSGYGSGDGYGYGSGDGSGSGDGYGSGYGSGDGDGDGEYWLSVMPSFLKYWTDTQVTRFHELIASKAHLAFWRSNKHGQPANSGQSLPLPAAPGVRHTTNGPLNLCRAGTLHATRLPPKWQGDRIWIVALHGEVVGDEEKFGCLEREIIGECRLSGNAS